MDDENNILPSIPEEDIPVEVLHIANTSLGAYIRSVTSMAPGVVPPHQLLVKGFPYRVKQVQYNWINTYNITFTDGRTNVMGPWASVQVIYFPTSKDPMNQFRPLMVGF